MRISKKIILTILSISIFFILWHILYKIENHDVIVPSIQNTINELGKIIINDGFLETMFATIYRTIIGFMLSLVLGFIFGFLSGLNNSFEYFMKPYILILRSTPIVAIMLIALIWINSYNVPILVNILLCFPLIYQEVLTGVKNADKSMLEFAKVHRLSKLTILLDIYLPSVLSHVISGIFVTLSLSFKTTISSEILSLPKYGIGSSIYNAKIYLNTSEVFAWLIIIICLSFIFDYILNLLKNSLLKGGK